MSYRDRRRDSGRRDGRRTELRLLEDEPATDRYDRPALWSRDELGPPSHGRRSRRSGHGRGRRPPAGGGPRDGERWLLDDPDPEDWDREDWHDRYRALRARSRWPLVFTAAGVVVLFFGGLMVVQPPGTSGVLGGPCMTVSCDRTTAPASAPATPSTSSSAPAVSASPAPPASAAPSATPSATAASPTASVSAGADPTVSPALRLVRVTYSVIQQSKSGFQGQFVIVNRSHTAIKDWRLVVVLPSDQVESAWDGSFSQTGDTVTFVPPAYALSIAPGARLTEQFTAAGTTVRPVSCTFSGASC
jgi:Cellulose binding domain